MSDWTTAAELKTMLERRWRSGAILKAYAVGDLHVPFALPVRRPEARDLVERRDAVNAWLRELTVGCAPTPDRPGLRIESTAVSGQRQVGHRALPRRVWFDTYEAIFGWLGVLDEITTLDRLFASTEHQLPAILDWAKRSPRTLLDHAEEWPGLLATVTWMLEHDEPLYLREVDPIGVDTHFIDQHRVLLGRLLDQVLPAARVDSRFGAGHFTARYKLRRRPDYTRIRSLGDAHLLPSGLSELTVRTEELSHLDVTAERVVIVENDASYLALPDLPDTLAILGTGAALGSVAGLTWLADRRIHYWGDVDTRSFVTLNRLRSRYPDVRSMLMDETTLLSHRERWAVEEKPTDLALPLLTHDESALYLDLVDNRHGHHLRLDQERISFGRVVEAFALD